MSNVKQILSCTNFPGEVDLFSRDRERVRQIIIDLFEVLLVSFKDCCDQLLQLKTTQKRRPNRLEMSDNTSLNSSIGDNGKFYIYIFYFCL